MFGGADAPIESLTVPLTGPRSPTRTLGAPDAPVQTPESAGFPNSLSFWLRCAPSQVR